MNLAQASPTDIQKAADYASQQSDRWLFVALLIIGLITIAFMVKYWMKLYDGLVAKLDSTNLYVRDTYAQQIKETTVVIAANTEALNGIRKIMADK